MDAEIAEIKAKELEAKIIAAFCDLGYWLAGRERTEAGAMLLRFQASSGWDIDVLMNTKHWYARMAEQKRDYGDYT